MRNSEKQSREQKKNSVKTTEYSKKALTAIIKMWFVGAVFGMLFAVVQLSVAPESAEISGLLTYIGTPMSCGIISYLIKSAVENKEKIRKSEQNPTEEVVEPHDGEGI